MPIAASQYIFGNSLVNFADGGARTTVPYYLDLLAEAAGNSYAMNGTYGFLRDFADAPEPVSLWGIAGVAPAWDATAEPFSDARFDSVMIAPANFIQDAPPDAPYPGDDRSPLDAMLDIIDQVIVAQPQARILIYEGWADMAPFGTGFPPGPDALAAWHDYNRGDYHSWYVSLRDAVNRADPDADTTLVPVAAILSEILTSTPLAELPVKALYVDDAPHGTETLYFLASLVTYQATFGEAPPPLDTLPGGIHPAVAAHYDTILAVIANGLTDSGGIENDAAPPPHSDAAPPPVPAPSDAPGTTAEPALPTATPTPAEADALPVAGPVPPRTEPPSPTGAEAGGPPLPATGQPPVAWTVPH